MGEVMGNLLKQWIVIGFPHFNGEGGDGRG
jgi:hypothetical protein